MVNKEIHISLKAEEIFHFSNFNFTNTLIVSFLALFILGIFAFILRKKIFLIPSGIQNLFEYVIEGALNLMYGILGSRFLAEKYLPFVFTVFLFILLSNWFGLLPGVGSIILKLPHENAPLLRSPSSDLNFTLGLAISAVIFVNLSGIITLGFLKHAKKFINFQNPIKFFVGILELVSEIAKMISFSFRLFGNVFAGEVLLAIVGFLVPYFIPLPFLFLEIFVGFIQAFVFAMLTLVFISIAVKEEH